MTDTTTDILLFEIVSWSTDVLTLIIALIFLYNYRTLPKKTYGIYMVLILNISNCIYPITDIILKFVPQTEAMALTFGALKDASYHFTLAWTLAIAVYTYLILYSQRIFNSRSFSIISFILCCIFCSLFATIVATQAFGSTAEFDHAGLIALNYSLSNTSDQILYFFFEDILGTLIPIIITFYCYFKVYRVLSRLNDSHINPTRVLHYPIIQMICYMPGIIADLVFLVQNKNYDTPAALTVSVLHRCWGFLNLLAYGFMNHQKERKPSIVNSTMTDNSASLSRDSIEIM